jgi:hypothetical protein
MRQESLVNTKKITFKTYLIRKLEIEVDAIKKIVSYKEEIKQKVIEQVKI